MVGALDRLVVSRLCAPLESLSSYFEGAEDSFGCRVLADLGASRGLPPTLSVGACAGERPYRIAVAPTSAPPQAVVCTVPRGLPPCLLMGTPAAALWGRTRGARACAKPRDWPDARRGCGALGMRARRWVVRRRGWGAAVARCGGVLEHVDGSGGRSPPSHRAWWPARIWPSPQLAFLRATRASTGYVTPALEEHGTARGRNRAGGKGRSRIRPSGSPTMSRDPHESIFHSAAGGLAAGKSQALRDVMSPPSRASLRGGPPRGIPPAAGPTWASSALLEAATRYAERAGAHLGGHADQAECAGCRRAKGRRQLRERDRRGQEAICHLPVVRSWRESFLRCVSFADRSVREIPAPVRALATQERNNDSNPRDDGCGWSPLRDIREALWQIFRPAVPAFLTVIPPIPPPPPTPDRPNCVSALALPIRCNDANTPLLNDAVRAAALCLVMAASSLLVCCTRRRDVVGWGSRRWARRCVHQPYHCGNRDDQGR